MMQGFVAFSKGQTEYDRYGATEKAREEQEAKEPKRNRTPRTRLG
jgi:hypothetical protein